MPFSQFVDWFKVAVCLDISNPILPLAPDTMSQSTFLAKHPFPPSSQPELTPSLHISFASTLTYLFSEFILPVGGEEGDKSCFLSQSRFKCFHFSHSNGLILCTLLECICCGHGEEMRK